MTGHQHLEIEHKFLVGPDFDVAGFRAAALSLCPQRTTCLPVKDTYFVTAGEPGLIFRHRVDTERQELTIKSRGPFDQRRASPADTEVRVEVNLALDQDAGDQEAAVRAFLAPLKIRWQGSLRKEIQVFYYPDCEVVYYAATARRTLRCVEFEATDHGGDVVAARDTLRRYEAYLGFAERRRTRASLFDLLLLPEMDAALAA